jgi:ribosomal protein L27
MSPRAVLTREGKQARKDVSQIFNNLLRRQIGSRWPTVEHLSAKEDTIFAALKGCVAYLSSFRSRRTKN